MAAPTGFITGVANSVTSAARRLFARQAVDHGTDDVFGRSEIGGGGQRIRPAYEFADPFAPSSRFRTSGSSTSLLAPSHARLVAACRDLVRNNPRAKNAVRILASACVRYGITPKFSSSNKRVQEAMETAFAAWVPKADVKGILDFNAIMFQIAWQYYEVGEVFVRFHVLSDEEANEIGLSVPFQLEIIESEQVSTESWTAPNGNRVITGIEVNARGARVAAYPYAKCAEDPLSVGSNEKVRLPFFNGRSGELLHIVKPMRGSYRGEPGLAVVGERLEQIDIIERALATSAQVQACFAGFIKKTGTTKPGNPSMPMDPAFGAPDQPGVAGQPPLKFIRPGSINYLNEDEEVQFANPQALANIEVLFDELQRAIAAGVGVPYELLTTNNTDTNYTGFRAGTIVHKDLVEIDQWTLMIPQFVLPVILNFTFLGFLKGKWETMVPKGITWGVPQPRSIDPVKDATATLIELKSGQTTLERVKAERGEDYLKDLLTMARIAGEADELGLTGFRPEGISGALVAAQAATAREDSTAVNSNASDGKDGEQTPRVARQQKKASAK